MYTNICCIWSYVDLHVVCCLLLLLLLLKISTLKPYLENELYKENDTQL